MSALRVESLARYLHNKSLIGRYCGWEDLPSDAQVAYLSEAQTMAGVLAGDVASEIKNYRVERP